MHENKLHCSCMIHSVNKSVNMSQKASTNTTILSVRMSLVHAHPLLLGPWEKCSMFKCWEPTACPSFIQHWNLRLNCRFSCGFSFMSFSNFVHIRLFLGHLLHKCLKHDEETRIKIINTSWKYKVKCKVGNSRCRYQLHLMLGDQCFDVFYLLGQNLLVFLRKGGLRPL